MQDLGVGVGVLIGYGLTWLFAMLSYALPHPTDADGKLYVIVYRSIHFVAANREKITTDLLPTPQSRTRAK